jgi:hypothetical protein
MVVKPPRRALILSNGSPRDHCQPLAVRSGPSSATTRSAAEEGMFGGTRMRAPERG